VDVPEESGPLIAWLPASAAGGDLGFASQAWLVDQRPQWDSFGGPRVPGRPIPGVKQLTFLRRAAGIDRETFASHWSSVHAPLARIHHPALWRYQQNVVMKPLLPGMDDTVDGIAELTMRLRLDFLERMYDSPAGRDIVGADVRTFLDLRASKLVWTRERPG
jgi:uncharacterized protein (TIGR02118 family)